MSVFGVDYAWGRPGPAALKRAGAHFACRYLSHDGSGKNLDHAEAKGLSDAGIWIVPVWESTAKRALDGHAAGAQDARDAEAQAKACGMPAGRPIYFAADWDATAGDQGAINDYLRGAASVLGAHRVGLYGGYGPISRSFNAGTIAWGWQTYAWSGGQWDSRAQLQQYSNDHLINGVGTDYNRAVKADYGQWRIDTTPPTTTEEDMPNGQLNEGLGTTGKGAITPIAIPKGCYKQISFIADNGLQGLPPAPLRVAVNHGGGHWTLHPVTVDSAKDAPVVTFPDPANTVGISVRREDQGDVHVAWEIS